MIRKLLISTMTLAATLSSSAQQRQTITLTDGWSFSRDNVSWTEVSVPHDWAIAGPFDKKWDLQFVAIEQNGEKEKTEKSGRSGALPWIGEGHYRTTVKLPKGYTRAILMIDGAMSQPTVTINGKKAGFWAYGYNAFNIDATEYLNFDGSDNEIAVDLKNVEESSRWYPGGGLYRPVRLLLTGKCRFQPWETFVRTVSVDASKAVVSVSAKLLDHPKGTSVTAEILDANGNKVCDAYCSVKDGEINLPDLSVSHPKLWSPETPYLYTLRLSARRGNKKVLDSETTRFGIRTINVSKEGGFQLNGVTRKIKGVCLHHDLGPLGAAENKAALIRQIKTMKDMGCDAIRTAHNMPSTMQMELCDSLGMMVMAESFDMWIYPKCKNGYATFFKEWADKDIINLVKHHRNHPSIVMWSIGNEIPEQWSKEGVEISKHLQDLCHEYDPTRPVTQGMDRAEAALKSGFAQVMDVPGFNYRVHKYENNIKQLPKGFLLGSETASTVSSRGVYKFPVTVSDKNTYTDGQCSSYDTEYCSWSNLPDDDWRCQEDFPWVIGEFVWTGYDYLGEPTPYDEYWPSRSSYFGICDLAGLPKDRYYLYRSHWNTTDHTVHLLPHWTWPGREGEVTPVYCYTDASEGELFVNGKSQGRIRKNKDSRLDRFRLRWNDVVYEPGEVKVVVYGDDGNVVGEQCIATASDPKTMILKADKSEMNADGADLIFTEVFLTDADGNFCPTLTDDLTFEVSGAGVFEAACNGDATSLQSFKQPEMKLFSGKAVVIVRSNGTKGTITLKVSNRTRNLSKTITFKAK